MRPMYRLPCAAAALLLLSGCASNRYCLGEQEYQGAQTLPPLKTVEGLRVPEAASALRIPPPPAQAQPFGTEDAEGNGVCLDKPPALAQQPVPAKSS